MKTIKTSKKLSLNKHIISEINRTEMDSIVGGAVPKTFKVCELLTITVYCSHTYTSVCV